MAEHHANPVQKAQVVRHRNRTTQVPIYLGKLFRSFIYQNDWKVLPMSAVIAALLTMVIRRDFFVTMEGTLKGSFGLTCVAIWNGCFNSIQSICRERAIIKREHRSGMHITAYIFAHMIYQAILCILQTIITLKVTQMLGVKYPTEGFITNHFMVDIFITVFLISYASDIISLFVSSVAHTTTGSMTVMPFLLIFQLVFSGGIFDLPAWAKPITNFTISNYGMSCICAQADYNNQPLVTAWNTIKKLKTKEIDQTIEGSTIVDALQNDKLPIVSKVRTVKVIDFIESLSPSTKEEASAEPVAANESNVAKPEAAAAIEDAAAIPDATAAIEDAAAIPDAASANEVSDPAAANAESTPETAVVKAEDAHGITLNELTFGNVFDFFAKTKLASSLRERSFRINFTVGELIDTIGEDQVRELIERETAIASHINAFEHDRDKILGYWGKISLFILAFALLSVISLEFIDKDKR